MALIGSSGISRQNLTENLNRLSAQRYLYSKVKDLILWQYSLTMLISFGGVVAYLAGIKLAPIASLYVFLDNLYFDKKIKGNIKKASLIQEAFDCDVLNIPWADIKCGARVPTELELNYAKKMKGNVNSQKLMNWYNDSSVGVSFEIKRILCQKMNISWSMSDRKRLLSRFDHGVFIVAVLLLFTFYIAPLERRDIFFILTSLIPLFRRGYDFRQSLKSSTDRLDHLQKKVNSIEISIRKNELSANELTLFSRELQSEIFDFRSREIPVFDWLYWKKRNVQEEHAIAAYVSSEESIYNEITRI